MKNILFYRFNLYPLFSNLSYFLFCLPYISPIIIFPTDTQPWVIIIPFLTFLIKPNIRKELFSIIIICLIYFSYYIFTLDKIFTFETVRFASNIFSICLTIYIGLSRSSLSNYKILKLVGWIIIITSILNFLFPSHFLSITKYFVATQSGGQIRGIKGLAPEPSFWAWNCIGLALLTLVNEYNLKRTNYHLSQPKVLPISENVLRVLLLILSALLSKAGVLILMTPVILSILIIVFGNIAFSFSNALLNLKIKFNLLILGLLTILGSFSGGYFIYNLGGRSLKYLEFFSWSNFKSVQGIINTDNSVDARLGGILLGIQSFFQENIIFGNGSNTCRYVKNMVFEIFDGELSFDRAGHSSIGCGLYEHGIVFIVFLGTLLFLIVNNYMHIKKYTTSGIFFNILTSYFFIISITTNNPIGYSISWLIMVTQFMPKKSLIKNIRNLNTSQVIFK